MTDLEILAELKQCYEYLYDIIENADYNQLNKEQREKLYDAKRNIENAYEEIFEAKSLENNIRIPGTKNLIIGDTPSADYYDIKEDIAVSQGDVVINGKEYEWWNDLKFIRGDLRICNECGKIMKQGYCIDGGVEYYCSDECLHKHYTEEEWNEMYEDGGDSYWTEWEE